MVKILRERVRECYKREEVNHPERCREHVDKYFKAFKKYRSEGEVFVNIMDVDVFIICFLFIFIGWFKYH